MCRITFAPWIAAALLITPVIGATQKPSHEMTSLERHVRHELVTLPFYGVFDQFQFQAQGDEVTLSGFVTRPTLKTDAEKVVKSIEGVKTVHNNIEVLPVSPNDDQIRMDSYRAIFYNPNFTRYAIQAVPPIHIIVKNGNVTLDGVVATKNDKTMAGILGNGVPGAFAVTNNLVVEKSRN